MTIVLDLDDVLANLRESLYQTLTRESGIDLHWRHWTHYNLRQHYSVIGDRLEEILIHAQTLQACQPEPRAAAITQALAELGHEIAIVTARGWHPQAWAVTHEWLSRHRIAYHHLSVVPLGGNKLEVLQSFENIILAVDDHPHHVTRYLSVGIPALLVDRPWNTDFRGERIYSLEAVLDYVKSKPSFQTLKPA